MGLRLFTLMCLCTCLSVTLDILLHGLVVENELDDP